MSSPTNDQNIVKRTSQYLDNLEHDETTSAKGVAIYGSPDGSSIYRQVIDATGAAKVKGISDLVGTNYDSFDLAYSGSSVSTITYKLSGVPVATLTFNYTGGNITNVTKS